MLSVYSGFTEEQVNEFVYKHYKNCIRELGIKLNYEATVNLYGNSYAQNASDIINKTNPFNYNEENQSPNMHRRFTKDMAMALMQGKIK